LLRPLFPVGEVLDLHAGGASPPDEARHGHVWPVATLVCHLDGQPAIAVELAFWPVDGLPEAPAKESWTRYRDGLDLTPIVSAFALRGKLAGPWSVDFGPHTFLYNASRPFQIILPRPGIAWEGAVRANGSCLVVVGTGLAVDDETGAIAIPLTAATTTAAYAGSRSVPDLPEIPGLYVVPVNSLRPYDPMRPATFILDTNVLIAMQRFCFAPARLGTELETIRHLLVNLAGRDVLPGLALAQLYQPSRSTFDTRPALEAFAAFETLRSLSRGELMNHQRPPATFDSAYERDVAGVGAAPQMLVMYAGVLRLRRLWNPAQTLSARAQSFETFMQWLRDELRLNAALLVQVAFNLWIADDDAQRQASQLLHFRARAVTDATLSQLWGTAYDLFLISGQADTKHIVDVVDVFVLTFDRGLAEMRDFFEHVEIGRVATDAGLDPSYGWNTRMKMNFHPRLERMKPRFAKLAAELQSDTVARLAERDSRPYPRTDLSAIVEREELGVLEAKA
jgi:hypothetical protein